jgi:AcrR family transcriptional regulator
VSDAGGDIQAAADGEDRATKGERTRRRLLELAIEQFGRKGFRATSVTEITREAGLTQAASYAYFESKSDLFREAVNTDVMELISSATEPLQETPVRDLLPSVLVLLAAKLAEHPLAVRVLSGQEPEAVAQLTELPALLDVRALLSERLAEAQASGELRADVDPARLATGLQVVLLSLLMGMTISRGTGPEPAGPEPEVIAGIMEVFGALISPPT